MPKPANNIEIEEQSWRTDSTLFKTFFKATVSRQYGIGKKKKKDKQLNGIEQTG